MQIRNFNVIFLNLCHCVVTSQRKPWESFETIVVSSRNELCQKKGTKFQFTSIDVEFISLQHIKNLLESARIATFSGRIYNAQCSRLK